jgi:hypothetical protein
MRELVQRAKPENTAQRYSPLKALFRAYSDIVDCTKKIDAPELCPWSETTRLQISIERDKNKAIQKHDVVVKQVASLNLYTDGSAKDGKVGAAAISWNARRTKTKYLGDERHSTIEAAEL